jgi:hypothetical protein
MISTPMKRLLLSFGFYTFVLHAQAVPLEDRGNVCGGLLDTRAGGSELCTNPLNAFTWDGKSPTLTDGKDVKTTCDHVVELSLMNSELEKGLCVPLIQDETLTDEEKKSGAKNDFRYREQRRQQLVPVDYSC